MKTFALVVIVAASVAIPQGPPREALRPAGVIPLPGVDGRFDHLAVDLKTRRLFIAALGHDTMEVVDLAGLKVMKSVAGLHEPQGIAFLPDTNRVVVANGGDGAAVFFDAGSLAVAATAKLSGDADNVRYDSAARRVHVGYAGGALAELDVDGRMLSTTPLAAHPESFQLESRGPRIFVNVPSAGHIAVVDRVKHAVTATWPVTAARANYPMALDEPHHRLYVGCRNPARLLVYDTDTGRLVTTVDIVGDTDDLFYDAAAQRLYVMGGEGFVTVLQRDGDRYALIQRLATAAGARTGLFVPELARLFVAVPHRGSQGAEIRVYETVN